MPIAAVLLDLGLPRRWRSVPILARAPPASSRTSPRSGSAPGLGLRLRWRRRSSTSGRENPSDPIGGRVPAGRAARPRRCVLPHAARVPLRALPSFYREKLEAADSNPPRRPAACRDRPASRHREARKLKATCTPENPIGAHLCVTRGDRPDLLDERHHRQRPATPLTAGDLDNWVTASARSYAASGVAPGQRIVSTYNAGPFAAGAALAAFERIASRTSRSGPGTPSASSGRSSSFEPAAVLDVLVRRPCRPSGQQRSVDLRGSSVERVLVAGEPGGGEPAFQGKARGGLGRQGYRGDGGRRHRRLALGRV